MQSERDYEKGTLLNELLSLKSRIVELKRRNSSSISDSDSDREKFSERELDTDEEPIDRLETAKFTEIFSSTQKKNDDFFLESNVQEINKLKENLDEVEMTEIRKILSQRKQQEKSDKEKKRYLFNMTKEKEGIVRTERAGKSKKKFQGDFEKNGFLSNRYKLLGTGTMKKRFNDLEDEIMSIRDTFRKVKQKMTDRAPKQDHQNSEVHEEIEENEENEENGQENEIEGYESEAGYEDNSELEVDHEEDLTMEEEEEESMNTNAADKIFGSSDINFEEEDQEEYSVMLKETIRPQEKSRNRYDTQRIQNELLIDFSSEEEKNENIEEIYGEGHLKKRIKELEEEKERIRKENVVLKSHIYKNGQKRQKEVVGVLSRRCKESYNCLLRKRINYGLRTKIRELNSLKPKGYLVD